MRAASLYLALAALLAAAGCRGDDAFRVDPVEPQLTYVGEFLRVPLSTRNGSGAEVQWSYSAPDLPFIDRWAFLVPRGAAAEFQWTPTLAHVGVHTITVNAAAGDLRASRAFNVEVVVAREAAPVFASPGPGAAIDLSRTPCTVFDVVAADRDTAAPSLRVAFGMPEGATFVPTGDGRGRFAWCPRPDQVAAAQQWVVTFEATDGEHAPVLHDHRFVLLSPAKAPCAGTPPTIEWLAPGDGTAVVSKVGYVASLRVVDDRPLRDRPVLFFTDGRIEQRDQLTLDQYRVAPYYPDDNNTWTARIPTFRLAEDEAKNLSLVALVSDDDDPSGTRCDNLAPLRLRQFTAIGAVEAGVLDDCDVCQVSGDCISGVCARTPLGGRCIRGCELGDRCPSGDACTLWNAMEGVVRTGCGPAELVCLGVEACAPDRHEPNDTRAAATAAALGTDASGRACERDDDWFVWDVPRDARVTVASTGDVEVQLYDETGGALAVSATRDGGAAAAACVRGGGRLFARVFSPWLERADYTLTATAVDESCACVDDGDELREPVRLPGDAAVSARLCGHNGDTFALATARDTRTTIDVTFDGAVSDVDADVFDATGALVAASRGTGGDEQIVFDPDDSRAPYTLRVFSYDGRDTAYDIRATTVPLAPCESATDCAVGEVCASGRCRAVPCERNADCGATQLCPLLSLDGAQRTCVERCVDDRDCADGRVCKQFFEGAACDDEGDGAMTATCSQASDCVDALVCVDWPDGHCAAAGCDRGLVCGPNAGCAVVDGRASCVQTCWESDEACSRDDGYACREVFRPNGEILYGCIPAGR